MSLSGGAAAGIFEGAFTSPELIRLTNGRLVVGDNLVEGEDLWICSRTGKIVDGRDIFFNSRTVAGTVIDLQNKIVAPGLIDVQLNGSFNFDFSNPKSLESYADDLVRVNKSLITLGVTSYLPTLTTSASQTYHDVLRFLGPSGVDRDAHAGAESLGAHCEGPFMSTSKNGIHNPELLQSAAKGWSDIEACYGRENLDGGRVKMITAAPEVGLVRDTISEVAKRGIVFSIGHTNATYTDACDAVSRGATMITHMFNAMSPLHHRNPGVVGLLNGCEGLERPYYGIICDGIHLHPMTIRFAFTAHPEGCILVTDAMHLAGMEDGVYDWTEGDRIVKKGPRLTLEHAPEKIAGSSVTLLECLNNFIKWTGTSVAQAISSVTEKPAKMLGLYPKKGSLIPGADADLVILDEVLSGSGDKSLYVDRVFKFGQIVVPQLHNKA
ncbi:N-acetylglucosamine-6-phosphate deacetylase [Capronia coronata CBS 617.96]|uniref:N-acetylglucosamine-6-phosphate deacetylase n=1 Tax=Capronia coronata CBS 617.96 TaxID=1182541 RepID=W9ZPW8_9EURO|nr:N-acetylglucosamine-6-phosphate deacetylase [Capronia coronata CBS 617.96]EXJ96519.1 N-acetylglucosamine-6-phosphate deacetylase [Capronia coronata CBS 617.96]